VFGKISGILLDNTDRNRTSPLHSPGINLSFRAVGSSAKLRWPYDGVDTYHGRISSLNSKKEVDALIAKNWIKTKPFSRC